MKTKNITVSIDAETHRRARIRAAELDTSVSALVGDYLRSLADSKADGSDGESEAQRRRRLLQEVFADFDARGVGLDMSENLSREELYDRDRARADNASEHRRNASD